MSSLENRKFERIRVENFKIKYRISDVEMNAPSVSVINVSAGGVCFLRDSVLMKNDKVEVLFPFKSNKIILKAKVIRVEGREVAVKFIENDSKIDDFVDLFNNEYKLIRLENAEKEAAEENLFSHKNKLQYSSLKDKLDDDKMFDPESD